MSTTPRSASTLALVAALAAAPAAAQNNFNEVVRFGARDLVQTAVNTNTKFPLEVPGAQPAEFMAASTAGVPAGTLTWIWYPSQLNQRLEPRQVTGHLIAVRPSSATPLSAYSQVQPGQTSAGVPIYIPKFSIFASKPRPATPVPFGPGHDPDFSKPPLLTYNTLHTPLVQPAQADQALVWTITYNTKIRVDSAEVVLGFEWQGGEHFTKPLSQSVPTGWSENHFAPSHWGWAAPAPGRAITRFDSTKILPPPSTLDVYTSPFGGYLEDQATISFHSDWGELREPTLSQTVYPSYNVGSGLSDAASRAGNIGWDVFSSTNHQGMRAIPLLNVRVGGPVARGTPILGQTVEVDLADPDLALAWGVPLIDGMIGANGLWLPPRRLPVPALGPAAVGLWVGMEYAIADLNTGAVPATTQATWFYIEK